MIYCIEMNLTAIIILIIISVNLHKKHECLHDEKLFAILIFLTMVQLISDTFGWGLNGVSGTAAHIGLYLADIIYFMFSGITGFCWLQYVEARIGRKVKNKKLHLFFVGLPMMALVLLSVLTPINHWIFYIDEANVYHRGCFQMLQIGICIFYLLYSSAVSIYYTFFGGQRMNRNECCMIVGFTVFPIFGTVAQVLFYGLTMVWIGATLSLLIIFINIQNSEISIDALTKLNNRGKFDSYLSNSMNTLDDNKELYLIVMDINHFKEINDTYGHVEGDVALCEFASILRKIAYQNNDFLARYGGDEFVMVCCRGKGFLVEDVIGTIESSLGIYNLSSKKPYTLASSFGVARVSETKGKTLDELKKMADERMYADKQRRKKK